MSRPVAARLVFLLCATLAFAADGAPAAAQQTEQAPPAATGPAAPPPAAEGSAESDAEDGGADVLVAGVPVRTMCALLRLFSPAARAAAAMERIGQIAKSADFEPDRIQTIEHEGHVQVVYEATILFAVLPEDLLPDDPRSAAQAAADVARSLGEAIAGDQLLRTPRRLAIAVGLALLVLVLFLLAVRIVLRAFRWLVVRVEGWKGTILRGVHLRGLELVSADAMVKGGVKVVIFARIVVLVLLFYTGASIILELFPWTRPYSRASVAFTLEALGRTGRAILDFIPNLFMIALIIAVVYYINRFMGFLFDAVARGALQIPNFHPDVAGRTHQIFRLLTWIFGLVVIFPYLPGAGTPAFQGIGVLVGLMVSFGSAGAIGNLVAGIVLTYSRSFSVGDRVKIADTMGDVIESGILSTKVVTIKNEEVTIPNAAILGSHIVNYTEMAESQGLILHTTVTIGYDVPWRQVHQILIDAARTTPGILPKPEPFVLQKSLDDFYVSYEINAYTREPARMAVIYGAMHERIQDAFFSAGVEILSPHYGALRDGNTAAIPEDRRPKDYRVPRFGVDVRSTPGPSSPRE